MAKSKETKKLAPAIDFVKRSCRKNPKTGGYTFKGTLPNGFTFGGSGNSKEAAAAKAREALAIINGYVACEKAAAAEKRKLARQAKAAAK